MLMGAVKGGSIEAGAAAARLPLTSDDQVQLGDLGGRCEIVFVACEWMGRSVGWLVV
jgi:hypothetical protein